MGLLLMGMLRTHNLAQLQPLQRLVNFVETGTWKGDGLMHALQFPFTTLWSVEASLDLMHAARARISRERPGDNRWEIIQGDSVLVVPQLAGLLRIQGRRPTLWWLDAHLPERYGIDATQLPLEDEVAAIVAQGSHQDDVFILDDWRLYEYWGYESGPWDGELGNGGAIRDMLHPTHVLTVDLRAEGALIAVPVEI